MGKLMVQRNAASWASLGFREMQPVEMQGQTPDSEKAASLDAWTSSEFREMLFRWSWIKNLLWMSMIWKKKKKKKTIPWYWFSQFSLVSVCTRPSCRHENGTRSHWCGKWDTQERDVHVSKRNEVESDWVRHLTSASGFHTHKHLPAQSSKTLW